MLKDKKDQSKVANSFISTSNVNSGPSIFGGSSANGNNLFGNVTPGPCGNIFGGTPAQPTQGNIFGGNTTTTNHTTNQNVFGSSTNSFNQNIFSSTANLFNSAPTPAAASSNPTFSNQNIFSSNPPATNSTAFSTFSFSSPTPSGNSLFGSQNEIFKNANVSFNNQSNIFGGGNQQQANTFVSDNSTLFKTNAVSGQNQSNSQINNFTFSQPVVDVDYSVFSKMEDLTREEIDAFSAATFVFGKIPLKPPPLETCK